MGSYKGRIWGFLIGLIFFNPLTAVIGSVLGYFLVDKPNMKKKEDRAKAYKAFTQDANYNLALVDITFSLAGYVARGAGHINTEHIKKANQIMDTMQLSENARVIARSAFNEGKSESFDLGSKIAALNNLIGGNTSFIDYLLEIEIQVALSDKVLTQDEQYRLMELARYLGVPSQNMARLIQQRYSQMILESMFSGQSYGGDSQGNSYNQGYSYSGSSDDSQNSYYQSQGSADKLQAAYDLLGISKDASDEEVKRAHKKLMLKYHPDRLASQGLTQEMIRLYTEKAKDIQAAFDLIKKSRNM